MSDNKEQCRAEFESRVRNAWANEENAPDLSRDAIGDYTDADMFSRFVWWKAAWELAARATPAQPDADEQRAIRIGKHVLEFATRGGWKDDGEGAFEYIQRHSYAVGFEDAGGKLSQFGTHPVNRWPIAAITAGLQPSPSSVGDATGTNKQTDLSKRLRAHATGGLGLATNTDNAMLLAAAEEIERYYTGMLNWKATAEKQNSSSKNSNNSVGDAIRALPLPEPRLLFEGNAYDVYGYEREDLVTFLSEAAALAEQVQGQQVSSRINLKHGAYITREIKTTGESGWLLCNEHGLVRALNGYECELVDSALAAAFSIGEMNHG